MPLQSSQSLRHVPWTCKWGRFGGPIETAIESAHGFVFWRCANPMLSHPNVLQRGMCEACRLWEAAPEFAETLAAERTADIAG
ncbi:MAG TPA: hypothetical protein VD833_23755 [Vicinamibacterales bacterium]|nr:hypothetical protein [Vicinamibacterales bacterium]